MALKRPKFSHFKTKLSTQSRLNLLCLLLILLALLVQFAYLGVSSLFSLAICTAGLLLALLLHWMLMPLIKEIQALNLHAQNLQDGSFNTSANQLKIQELGSLASSLQNMSAQLRAERATLYQRELLLDTVLQSSTSALLLTDANDAVLMSNPAARQLLMAGKAFDGSKLTVVAAAMPALADAIAKRQQGLLRLPNHSVWHLSVNQFQLNHKQHWLYLLKPLSREIAREELNAWKTLLRVISHELNNTLAPLSSMAYSGQVLAARQQQAELAAIFTTITERCAALNQFLQSYIRFAKLPAPTPGPVNWVQLINQLQDQYEFELIGELPSRQWQADQGQLSQLLLNLLKNAHETGCSPEQIQLSFSESPSQLQLCLQDQGGGIATEVMQQALLPFYTTKANGSGIGLTLCRDIIEAHGGELRLQNQQGGLSVVITLPATIDA